MCHPGGVHRVTEKGITECTLAVVRGLNAETSPTVPPVLKTLKEVSVASMARPEGVSHLLTYRLDEPMLIQNGESMPVNLPTQGCGGLDTVGGQGGRPKGGSNKWRDG